MKELKERIKLYLESVPVKDRKRWIVLSCVLVVLLSVVKTAVHIQANHRSVVTASEDTVYSRKMNALKIELERIEGDGMSDTLN